MLFLHKGRLKYFSIWLQNEEKKCLTFQKEVGYLSINKLVMAWIKAKYICKYKDISLMKIICLLYLNGCIHFSITVSAAQKGEWISNGRLQRKTYKQVFLNHIFSSIHYSFLCKEKGIKLILPSLSKFSSKYFHLWNSN